MITVDVSSVIGKDFDEDGVYLQVYMGDGSEPIFISWDIVRYMKDVYEIQKE